MNDLQFLWTHSTP